ncbi:MAG: hypothetical protein OWU33_09160 [Firmicutes bacterium]|nr:hypothetical protein [Bacillota bacterium]
MQRQRYRCRQCRRACVDAPPGLDDQRQVTERLTIFVAQQVVTRPFTAAATEVGLDERTVRAVFPDAVDAWDRTRTLVTSNILGIDEVVLDRPRCILTNVEEHTLLDILPHRTYERVLAHLRHLPQPDQVH